MPFALTDYPGLFLNLQADALVLNDGDPVGTWADASGGAHDFTEATNKPTYHTNMFGTVPGVTFDGTNDCLACSAIDLSNWTGATLYMVMKTAALPSAAQILFESSANYSSNIGSVVAAINPAGTIDGGCNSITASDYENWNAVALNTPSGSARPKRGRIPKSLSTAI